MTHNLSYESYVNLINQLDDLVAVFEQHPDPQTREQVMSLLNGLDMLHREGMSRLVETLRAAGAGEALEQATDDPVVEILLGLYDLTELELPPDEPPSTDFIPLDEIGVNGKQQGSAPTRSPIQLDSQLDDVDG